MKKKPNDLLRRYPYKTEIKEKCRQNPGKTYFYENIYKPIENEHMKVYITYSERGDRYFYTRYCGLYLIGGVKYEAFAPVAEKAAVIFMREIQDDPIQGKSEYINLTKPISFKLYNEIMKNYTTPGMHWSEKIDELMSMNEEKVETIQMMVSIGGLE